MTKRAGVLLHLLMFSLAGAPRANATPKAPDPARDQARRNEEFDRGVDALAAKNWELAYRIFSKLWTEQPSFDVASSLGQTELNLKRYRDAAEHLAFGLRTFPAREDPELLKRVQAGLAEATKRVGTLRIDVNQPGATLFVDGKAVGRSPLASEVYLDPGPHTIEAQLNELEPVRQDVIAMAGTVLLVELRFASPRGTSEAPKPSMPLQEPQGTHREPPAPRRDHTAAYVAGTIAGVGILTGIGGLVLAHTKEEAVNDRLAALSGRNQCGARTPHVSQCDDLRGTAGAARTWRAIGWAGLGTGLAAGIATVYFAWPRSGEHSTVAVRLRGSPSASGAFMFTELSGDF